MLLIKKWDFNLSQLRVIKMKKQKFILPVIILLAGLTIVTSANSSGSCKNGDEAIQGKTILMVVGDENRTAVPGTGNRRPFYS